MAIYLPETTTTTAESLTPRQIVAELDKYVIGQAQAKRAVAIALRNRTRRQKLPADLAEDIAPKNILMIGPTGVGKTEIARRLARLAQSPFLKVEASKFTEVGYVGRDVESMVRDLVELAVNMVREERIEEVKAKAELNTEEHWAWVQPGVVQDQLNAYLRPHGFLFGPDTSTRSRATIGGMTGNNSAGARSVIYGKTIDHVLEVKVVLSDGSTAHFQPVEKDLLEQKMRGQTLEAQIYRECVRYYPFVLGAQPVRPLDLAAFYAAIANEGLRPVPHSVDSIDRDGQTIYRYQQTASGTISSVDRAAFYQLKSMMQGVLARGTANAIAGLSPYVAGKTGTSDDENDAWFVGFTNDVTVAVWLGYDNATGKRRTLGGGATGGGVAVPIFEPIIQAVWANVAPKMALAPPSPEAKRQLSCKSIDLDSGEVASGRGKAVSECFRVDARGKVIDTQYRLVSRESASTKREAAAARARRDDSAARTNSERPYSYQDPWRAAPQWDSRWDYGQRGRQQQPEVRRADPNSFWNYHR